MAALLVAVLPGFAAAAEPPPATLFYWHNWTDAAGTSHISRCSLHRWSLHSMAPDIAPEWRVRIGPHMRDALVNQEPPGWIGRWHQNPKVQWIIPIRGAWAMTAMDGTRVALRPGDMALGEDQNTRPDDQGRSGHLSANADAGSTAILIVQSGEAPTVNRPCHVS